MEKHVRSPFNKILCNSLEFDRILWICCCNLILSYRSYFQTFFLLSNILHVHIYDECKSINSLQNSNIENYNSNGISWNACKLVLYLFNTITNYTNTANIINSQCNAFTFLLDCTEKWTNIIKINPNTLIFWMVPFHFSAHPHTPSFIHSFTHSLTWFISVLINWITCQNGLFQWFQNANSKLNNDNNPQNWNCEREKNWMAIA